jgi:hypothetical protein
MCQDCEFSVADRYATQFSSPGVSGACAAEGLVPNDWLKLAKSKIFEPCDIRPCPVLYEEISCPVSADLLVVSF